MMASAQPLSFGALLKRHRVAAGLTQEELAERAGLSVRAIGALESGARLAPRRDTVALLAQALGLSPPEHAQLASAARPHAGEGILASRAATRPISLGLGLGGPGLVRLPVVGRAVELDAVDRYLAGAGPPLLVVTGEPGIGKTRLLHEAVLHADSRGWTVLAGGCTRRSGQEPYAPFVGALTQWLSTRSLAQQRSDLQGCAWLVRLLPELAETNVAPALQWTLPPEQERRLVLLAVGRLLANVAGLAGTLLVLDDLQWAGADALGLLASLLQSSRPGPLRMLGAYRDTEVRADDPLPLLLADLGREGLAERMALASLARADAARLLGGLLGEEGAEHAEAERGRALAEEVLDRAEGLPFFLVSFAQELRAGALQPGPGLAGGAVPWSAAESIRQRVAVLPDGAKEVLAVAAVTGRQIPRAVPLAMVRWPAREESQVLDALDGACRARLLAETPDGAYVFAHDLIRETVLADLGSARRAVLHRHVAETLEALHAEHRAAELEWHFLEGDEPARALPYALQAGDHAGMAYAHSEAERHYRTALDLAREVGDTERGVEAQVKLGTLFDNLGRLDEAIAMLAQAARAYRLLGDRERLARAVHRLVRACHRAGRIVEGVEYLQALVVFLTRDSVDDPEEWCPELAGSRLAQALDSLAPATAAPIGASVANYLTTLGRAEEALPVIEDAAARARAAGDLQSQPLINYMRGNILRDLGRLDEAEQTWSESSTFAGASGALDFRAMALSNLGLARVAHGDLARADELHTQALEVGTQLGDPYLVAWSRGDLAELAFIRGDWGQARVELEAALEAVRLRPPGASRAAGMTYGAGVPLALLSRLDLAEGRTAEGLTALDEVLRLSERGTASGMRPWALQALAEYEVLAGEPEAAQARLDPLAVSAGVRESAVPATLAWALLEQGERERALQVVETAAARARAGRLRLVLVETLPVLARVALRAGGLDEAAYAADEALAVARSMPYPYAEAKALFARGRVHASGGELEQAHEHYEAALAICQRLGEGLYQLHIERALAQLGAHPV